MVKGEHLRPLLGFVVVCCTAALILASGLTNPAAIRRIVAEQRVLPGSSFSELVLGRTFEPAPERPAPEARSTAAADPQTSLVLTSFAQPTGSSTSATAARPRASTHTHHVRHAQHAAQATTKPAAPTTAPVSQPTAPPVTAPTLPTKTTHLTSYGSVSRNEHSTATSTQRHGWRDTDSSTTSTTHDHSDGHSRERGRHHSGGHGRGHSHDSSATPAAHVDHSHPSGGYSHGGSSHGGHDDGGHDDGGHSHGHRR